MSRDTLDRTLDSEPGANSATLVPTIRVLFRGTNVVSEPPFALPMGRVSIGREPVGAGVRLFDDTRASRVHAALEISSGRVGLVDLDSRNGTRLNDNWVTTAVLKDGDIVRCGDTVMQFRYEPAESNDADVPELRGVSPRIRELRAMVALLGPSDANTIITGESGAGKGVVARSLHRLSGRPGPFVAVNCGAIPEGLAESAFFGHRAGSFTGATSDHDGHFRAATGGTLFIDEVGELPLSLQPKLLHAVEARQVTPVGATKPVDCDVRLLSATNVDVIEAIREGEFRGDLYSRLSEMQIRVAPLRDRREDILLLLASALDPSLPGLSPHLAEALVTYDWPLNVRQLFAVAKELNLRGVGKERIELELVQDRLFSIAPAAVTHATEIKSDAPGKEQIEGLLRVHRGNVARAAEDSGRSKRQFYRLIKRHEIDLTQFR